MGGRRGLENPKVRDVEICKRTNDGDYRDHDTKEEAMEERTGCLFALSRILASYPAHTRSRRHSAPAASSITIL